jgi:transposase
MENMIMTLQDEIHRNDASRNDHRLHGVLLVAQGLTCLHVAGLLGDSPRTTVNWVQRFERQGWSAWPKASEPVGQVP